MSDEMQTLTAAFVIFGSAGLIAYKWLGPEFADVSSWQYDDLKPMANILLGYIAFVVFLVAFAVFFGVAIAINHKPSIRSDQMTPGSVPDVCLHQDRLDCSPRQRKNHDAIMESNDYDRYR